MSGAPSRPIDLVLQEAEQRQGNPIFNPVESTKELLRELEETMRPQTRELESRYSAFHGRLSVLAKRLIHDENKSEVRSKMEQLDAQRMLAEAEMSRISLQMDAPSLSLHAQKKLRKAAKKHLRLANHLLDDLSTTYALTSIANERFGKITEELDQLWKSLRDVEHVALSLAAIAATAALRIKMLKFLLLLIMLGVAFAVDRQTQVTEGLFQAADSSGRHDLAILVLFIGQAMFVEPVVAWLVKVSGWQVHRRLVKSGEDLKIRIQHIESQFAAADVTLTSYEKTSH